MHMFQPIKKHSWILEKEEGELSDLKGNVIDGQVEMLLILIIYFVLGCHRDQSFSTKMVLHQHLQNVRRTLPNIAKKKSWNFGQFRHFFFFSDSPSQLLFKYHRHWLQSMWFIKRFLLDQMHRDEENDLSMSKQDAFQSVAEILCELFL